MSNNDPIQAEVEKNYDAFRELLPDLLQSHPGQFAVMRHQEVVDTFDSIEDAARFAVAQYPDNLFSIQEITDATADQGFFSNTIALNAL